MTSKLNLETTNIGKLYESYAEKFFTDKGLFLITKNFSCRYGEIDLIMSDESHLIFIEVRYRNSTRHGRSIETITRAKQEKIIKTAEHFLILNQQYRNSSCRIDVIGIDKTKTGELEINWIKNAFTE